MGNQLAARENLVGTFDEAVFRLHVGPSRLTAFRWFQPVNFASALLLVVRVYHWHLIDDRKAGKLVRVKKNSCTSSLFPIQLDCHQKQQETGLAYRGGKLALQHCV
jgi:hypothetical protein